MHYLSNLSGAAFDRAYINVMIEARKDDIDEFEDALKKAKGAELQSWTSSRMTFRLPALALLLTVFRSRI